MDTDAVVERIDAYIDAATHFYDAKIYLDDNSSEYEQQLTTLAEPLASIARAVGRDDLVTDLTPALTGLAGYDWPAGSPAVGSTANCTSKPCSASRAGACSMETPSAGLVKSTTTSALATDTPTRGNPSQTGAIASPVTPTASTGALPYDNPSPTNCTVASPATRTAELNVVTDRIVGIHCVGTA